MGFQVGGKIMSCEHFKDGKCDYFCDDENMSLHKLSAYFDLKTYNEIGKDEHGKLIPTTISECNLVNCPDCAYDNENEICDKRGELLYIENTEKKIDTITITDTEEASLEKELLQTK